MTAWPAAVTAQHNYNPASSEGMCLYTAGGPGASGDNEGNLLQDDFHN